jgi:hypothetical protein
MTTKPLMKLLFGETRDLRQKQLRQFGIAFGSILLLCAIIVALVYLTSRQGRI